MAVPVDDVAVAVLDPIKGTWDSPYLVHVRT